MKILFLIRSLENGGAERQLVLLAKELGRRGHSVAIGVFYAGGIHEAAVQGDRVRLVDLKKGSRGNMVGFAAGLLRFIRQEKPDIVHGYLSAGNLAATLGQLAWRRAQLVWGIRDSSIDSQNYGWVTGMASWLMHSVSRRAQLMIFNSQTGFQSWSAAGFAVRKSICIPNGIDTTEFSPDPAAGLRFRQQAGIPDGVPLVGMVARFDPAKDHAGFLKSAAIVSRTDPETRFLCLGIGPTDYVNRLKAMAVDLGIADRVFWPAPTQAMRGVYNALDVFCLASHSEGFPNVIAEAMACGRSCVVTEAGDAAFVAGRAARVVPCGDAGALAAGILAALHDTDPRPTSTPRQRILDLFGIEAMASRTEAALVDTGAFTLAAAAQNVDPVA